jgi:hypothetical protein
MTDPREDTGLTNLPLQDFAQNQTWCAIVMLAAELTVWMQLLAPHDHEAPLGTETAPLPAVHDCCRAATRRALAVPAERGDTRPLDPDRPRS